MHRVLISAAGTGTAFGLASRLRANWGQNVVIVAADTNPFHLVTTSLLADKFEQLPPAVSENFDAELLKIIESNKIDTYLPLINDEIKKASALLDRNLGVDIWAYKISPEIVTNKKYCNDWLNGLGIATPADFLVDELQHEEEYFVKPLNGFGSRGAGKMLGHDIQDLVAKDCTDVLIQEICISPELTVDSFYDFETGYVRAVVRERIETKAGVCTKARVFEDERFTKIASAIGSALQQKGVICFQMMQTSSGWKVTDLNLRAGAGTAITVAAGIDVLSAAFACRWNEPYTCYLGAELPKNGCFVTRQYAEFLMS